MLPIGINLGTSFSRAAFIADRTPVLAQESDGASTVPSVVCFESTGVRLGRVALQRAAMYPQTAVRGAKWWLGRQPDDPLVADAAPDMVARILRGAAGSGGLRFRVGSETYDPAGVAAYVIQHLAELAQRQGGAPVKAVVLTAPAWFRESGRKALADAATRAGLIVERVVHEAAAVAVTLPAAKLAAEKLVAIVDVGAGGIGASLVRISSAKVMLVSSAGDDSVGGEAVDRALVRRCLRDLARVIPNGAEAGVLEMLRQIVETMKCDLSTASVVNAPVPFLPGCPTLTLDRQGLAIELEPLLRGVAFACARALAGAGAGASTNSIDALYVTGGMAQIPSVRTCIERALGKQAIQLHPSGGSVSLGAATIAGILALRVSGPAVIEIPSIVASAPAPAPPRAAPIAPPTATSTPVSTSPRPSTMPSMRSPQASPSSPSTMRSGGGQSADAAAALFARARRGSEEHPIPRPVSAEVPVSQAPPPPRLRRTTDEIATPTPVTSVRISQEIPISSRSLQPPAHASSEIPISVRPPPVPVRPMRASEEVPLATAGPAPDRQFAVGTGRFIRPANVTAMLGLAITRAAHTGDLSPATLPVLCLRLLARTGVRGVLTLQSGDKSAVLHVLDGRACGTPAELKVAAQAFTWLDGTYAFQPKDFTTGIRGSCSMVRLTVDGLRLLARGFAVEEMEAAFGAPLDLAPVLRPHAGRIVSRFGLTGGETRLVDGQLDGIATGRQLMRGGLGRHPTLLLLLMLTMFDAIAWRRPEEGRSLASLADEIELRVAKLVGGNHFEALSVHWSASPEDIDSAYSSLRLRFDPGSEWGRAAPKACARMLERAAAAYAVLRDPGLRMEHRREAYPLDYEAVANLVESRAGALAMKERSSEAADAGAVARELAQTAQTGASPERRRSTLDSLPPGRSIPPPARKTDGGDR